MQITLSNTLANDAWGKHAILSFDSNKAMIHLKIMEKLTAL